MKRGRRRYVLFRLHTEEGCVDEKKLVQTFRKSLLSLFGEVALADSRLFLSKFDEATCKGVLQCSLESLEQVLTSAAILSSVDGVRVSFQPLKTSGTIRGLM